MDITVISVRIETHEESTMRKTTILLMACLLTLLATIPSDAGCGLFGRARARRAARSQSCGTAAYSAYTFTQTATCATASCPTAISYPTATPQYPTTSPPPLVVPSAPQPIRVNSTFDGPSAFLATLNAARAAQGRPPAIWDSALASWASRNSGVHSVLAPGSNQCWAGTASYSHAVSMWLNSPAHASYLIGCTYVGVSPCASGMTANCR